MISKFKALPETEQVSDDFSLFTDGSLYYAVRAMGEGGAEFVLSHRNKDTLVAAAVHEIHKAILAEEPKKLVPNWNHKERKLIWL
jgi:hypothetical protein